jgi:hypothetical protein
MNESTDIRELIATARRHRVVIHFDPPGRTVLIHNHRDPNVQQQYVEPLRQRRAEVAACLAGNRPSPVIPPAEERYRADVLREPDVPVSEVTWPVLYAMLVSTANDVYDARRAEEEWERTIAGRDTRLRPPPAAPPGPPQRLAQKPGQPPTAFEFRGGKVVRR